MKRRVVARATSLLFALALSAHAAGSPFSRVALLLPNCEQPGLIPGELREAVALDLRDEHLTLAPAGELSPATDVLVRIEATCSTDSELTLHAEFGAEHHSRRADLRELPPPQRARALSLAVAELLALFSQPPSAGRSQFPEPPAASATPEPAASAAPPAASPAASATPPPAPKPAAPAPPNNSQRRETEDAKDLEVATSLPTEWGVSLAPQLRFFDASWLWGARALVHYGAWSAGVDLLRSQVSVKAGSVTTLLVHGTFAYSFELLPRSQRSAFTIGPRLGFGRAFLTAQAAPSALAYDAQDVYFDAALGAHYAFRISPAFRLGLAAELGYARGPIGYADDVVVTSTAGSFAAVLVEAGVRF